MENQKFHIHAATLIPRYGCVTSLGELANSGVPAHQGRVMGLTEGRIELGAWGDVTIFGIVYDQAWTWTPGGVLYLNGTVLSHTSAGFVQQIGWALTAQSILVYLAGVGAPGPAGPASVIIRDTWNPAPPPDPAVNTLCVFRDGTASRTWDATFGVWI